MSVKCLRKLEKAGTQVTKLSLDLKYFEKCLELGICPKYLRFKPPKLPVYKNCKNVYRQVVNNQINVVKKDLKYAKSKYISELKFICSKLSFVETIALKHLLKKRYEALSIPVLQRHNQKLLRLWKDSRTRSPECLLNLSDAKLTILEENVLRLGLKHHILPKKIDEMSL